MMNIPCVQREVPSAHGQTHALQMNPGVASEHKWALHV
jgi:hypothetical protein